MTHHHWSSRFSSRRWTATTRRSTRLREDEREMLIGRLEMGLSYDELAEASGRPTADAARRAAQRALVKLVEEMHRAG